MTQIYIPTGYPNVLPGCIPIEEYEQDDTRLALALASEILGKVKKYIDV